jgi:adenylate cyclase
VDARAAGETLAFEGWHFDRQARLLYRQDAIGTRTPVLIGSRAQDILTLLLEQPGTLVSKDAIMEAVWPNTAVEANNLNVQVAALRRVLDRDRSGASCIQTVSGRGYRFVAAVTRLDEAEVGSVPRTPPVVGRTTLSALVSDLGIATTQLKQPGARHRLRSALTIAAAALVVTGAAVTGWWWFAGNAPPNVGLSKAPRLSIVVLPFEDLSGDPKDNYLVEGITEDVTTDLSRVLGMFVIARESAYTYQGKATDVRKIGEELGVRYALEGSVRKLGDALRVNAQLISTETGAHLWADRFDQKLNDLSAGQEEIVGRIGQTLNVALTDVESARSKRERPTNPDAFDLILRARSLGLHPMGPPEHAERRALFEQALRLDPDSIFAMTRLADEIDSGLNGWGATEDERERAAKLIADAAANNPNDPNVLEASAYLIFQQGRYAEAISAYRRLLDEYPNSHYAYDQIGMCLTFTGRANEAIPMIETAIRHDPRNPNIFIRYGDLGFSLLMLGRDEESIIWSQRALAADPNSDASLRATLNLRLAAAYARLGHLDEAHRGVAEANRLWPYDTVRMHWPDDPSSRVYAEQIERFQTALRLAGHRDHAEEDANSGVASDNQLHSNLVGLTPTTVPGAATITTAEIARLLDERKPIVIDPLFYSWGRSIPSGVGLKSAGSGGSTSDAMQGRLRKKMQELTKYDLSKPIVALGFNSERFDGRNLALRLVALGYTNVYWYRGGREAWEVAGLPETELDVQQW